MCFFSSGRRSHPTVFVCERVREFMLSSRTLNVSFFIWHVINFMLDTCKSPCLLLNHTLFNILHLFNMFSRSVFSQHLPLSLYHCFFSALPSSTFLPPQVLCFLLLLFIVSHYPFRYTTPILSSFLCEFFE